MPGKSRALLELEQAQAVAPLPNGPTEIPYRPAYAARCYDFALLGMTEAEMAEHLGISHPTFSRWKVEHQSLAVALRKGGKQADGRVARALYRRAVGMESVEKRSNVGQDGKEQVVEIKRKTLAPDVAAASMWLANRARGKWRAASAGDVQATLDLDAMVGEIERRAAERQARPGDDARPVNTLDVVPERDESDR